MSIIYDALQKTQKNLENKRGITHKKKTKWLDKVLLIVIVGLVGVNLVAYYPRLVAKHSATPIIKKVLPIKPSPVASPKVVPAPIQAVVTPPTMPDTRPTPVNHPPVEQLFNDPPKTTNQKILSIPASSPGNEPSSVPAATVNETPYQGQLMLNGIFVSDEDKMALINHQTFHVGDLVENFKIVSIEVDKVKLENNGKIFVMK